MGNQSITGADALATSALNDVDGMIEHGVVGHINNINDYTHRSAMIKLQERFSKKPLGHTPDLETWCPEGYSNTIGNPVTYPVSIPGRISHRKFGCCNIHASCQVRRYTGASNATMYLVTLVDSVKINGYYDTQKRLDWYEIPNTLVEDGVQVHDFCTPVPCIIDNVDYNFEDPANSSVTLVYASDPSNPVVTTLKDVIKSTEGIIKTAYEFFKYDNPTWVVEYNIDHVTSDPQINDEL